MATSWSAIVTISGIVDDQDTKHNLNQVIKHFLSNETIE